MKYGFGGLQAVAASDSEEDFFDALEELDDDKSATTIGWGEGMIDTKNMKRDIAVVFSCVYVWT